MARQQCTRLDDGHQQRARRTAGLLGVVLAVALVGCTSGHHDDAPPTITVDNPATQGVTYGPWADAVVPAADVTAIGSAAGDLGSLVTDDTVYAIRQVDPAGFIALLIDGERYQDWVSSVQRDDPEYVPPVPAPAYEIWTGDRDASAPVALCAYFDPRSDRFTPPECQAPPSVTLDGVTYLAIVEEQSKKMLPVFAFAASNLEAAGTMQDLDPRLAEIGSVDATAYAITGIEPSQAIVVRVENGADQYHYVFVADGAAVPEGICAYVSADLQDTTDKVGAGPCTSESSPGVR